MKKLLPALFLLTVFFTRCQTNTNHNNPIVRMKEVLNQSVTDWNNGDITAYMQCYVHSDSLQFDGNGTTTYGWEKSLERYKKAYPDKKSMGQLQFSAIKIRLLSPTAAFVSGHWELTRENSHPEGLFTLLFRKTPEGWRIIYDHSSSKIR